MSKKVIGIIAALAILIPGLALAEQPSDSLPVFPPDHPPGFPPGKSLDTLSEEVRSHIPEGIYRTGTPDFDKAREFHISQTGNGYLFQHYPVIGSGYWPDGYYQVTLDEERWDGDWEIVDELVAVLTELGGEDLPIRIAVGTIKLLSEAVEVDEVEVTNTEATGGDRAIFVNPDTGIARQNTLSFLTEKWGWTYRWRFVGTGHFLGGPVPQDTEVYDEELQYLGAVELAGGELSDTSRVRGGYWSSILPGVKHYSLRLPYDLYMNPFVDVSVYRTGASSGTTWGEVLAYEHVYNPAHETVLENQVLATCEAIPGDSGAPLYFHGVPDFPVPLSGTGTVSSQTMTILHGVLWGGTVYEGEEVTIYSPIYSVMAELDVTPYLGDL